jgi:hypothetical protein
VVLEASPPPIPVIPVNQPIALVASRIYIEWLASHSIREHLFLCSLYNNTVSADSVVWNNSLSGSVRFWA